MKIYTVGYEGRDIDEFTTALKKNKIQLIIDIRKNPLSRKKGFSKKRLAENLALKKIDYLHLGGLGVPSLWRKQAKAELITRKKMFKDYVKKVLPIQQNEMAEVLKVMKQKKAALLCYEADASDCHRRYVTDELQRLEKKKIEVIDLDLSSVKLKRTLR